MTTPRLARRAVQGTSWLLVGVASLATASALGTVTALGALVGGITAGFGSTAGTGHAVFALAVSTSLLAGAVTGPLAQRRGARPLLAAGAVLLPAGLLAVAAAPTLPVAVVAAVLGVGGGAGCVLVPMLTVVGIGPAPGRASAIALVSAGGAAGSAVLVPAATWVAAGYGPTAGLLALGGVTAAVLGAGAAVVPATGSTRAARPAVVTALVAAVEPAAAPAGAIRWYLSSAAVSAAVFVPFAHLPAYASAHGSGLSSAAAMVSVMSVASLAGRLFFAAVALRVGTSAALRASALGLGAALAWWLVAGPRPLAVLVFAAAFGTCHGGYVASLPAALAERYGPAGLGGRFGALYTATAVGALLGPGLAGAVTVWTGHPAPAIAVAAGAALGGCALLPGTHQPTRQATSSSGA